MTGNHVVLLSSRYGLSRNKEHELWRRRHRTFRESDPASFQWCICPPEVGNTFCAQPATQEDRLCDECRSWCIALGSGGLRVQFALLPSWTSVPVGFGDNRKDTDGGR